mmetsp:Transcript_12020/g.15864  ORF Transcript_12020/g.15864 Transcript_12020/m.15864 type:complete len:228 (-) Transcript_12020:472-1155(-)
MSVYINPSANDGQSLLISCKTNANEPVPIIPKLVVGIKFCTDGNLFRCCNAITTGTAPYSNGVPYPPAHAKNADAISSRPPEENKIPASNGIDVANMTDSKESLPLLVEEGALVSTISASFSVPLEEENISMTSTSSCCCCSSGVVSFKGNKVFDHCSNSSDIDIIQPKLEPHNAAIEKEVKNGLLVIALMDDPSLPPESEVKHHDMNINVGNNDPKKIAEMHFFLS